MTDLRKRVAHAAEAVRRACGLRPAIGLVLGTGLGSLANRIEGTARIPYEDIPCFRTGTADTHAGELIIGTLAGKPVAALSGRFHAYEGCSLQEVTFPIRVLKAIGIHAVILSNAAGGLNPAFSAGDLMVITDHINWMGGNPLIGPNDDALGPRFPDMSEPYSKELIALAESAARAKGISLKHGVYLACPGPSLETRAEYRFMRLIGADAVGMSTVPEVIVAVHAGLRVLAFSAITDECFPETLQPADVNKIIATANRIEPTLAEVLMTCIGGIQIDPEST